MIDHETRLIRALLNKNREIELLKIKMSLYTVFLTPQQKKAADEYAEVYTKMKKERKEVMDS